MKPQTDSEKQAWCGTWDISDHAGKIEISKRSGITYDSARHWRSEFGCPKIEMEPTLFPPPPEELRANTPTLLTTKRGLSTALILGDMHIPYQDVGVVRVAEKFIADKKPDYIIYNGDITDFYQVSDFSKDPRRLGQLQDDIDITVAMFRRHKRLSPESKLIFVEGTHENRWFKYMQRSAPAASRLRGNTIQELYKLDELGIEYVPFERGLLVNGTFLFLHGDIASKHSSMTARNQYESHGGSGMCNHTHRGGSFFKRDRFGTYGWWENFCMCSLDPDWITNPNWQQGFSIITFEDGGRYFVEQIPVMKNKFIYGGRIY